MSCLLLRETVPMILDCLRTYDYTVNYLNELDRRLNCVVFYYEEMGILNYTPGQYEMYLSFLETEYALGNLTDDLFRSYRKCAYYLDEFGRCGTVRPKMLLRNNKELLKTGFQELLNAYLSTLHGKIKESTIYQRQKAIYKYLYFFQRLGYDSVEQIAVRDVQQYFVDLSATISNRTLNQSRLHIRQFHIFLHESGKYAPNWLSFFDFRVAYHKKMQGYLTSDEIDNILSVIDTATSTGKRDYAIISLARTTGLRGGDVISLKLEDIDWLNGVISVTQNKTGAAIQLPLLAETGEAIKDYILNGRPETTCQEIFIRANAPYSALLGTASLDAIIRKYEKKANLDYGSWDGKAFHGTRRGLGRDLVRSGVPVTSIMQVLGHKNLDSSKPYMKFNTPELKECALDFANISIRRRELL